MPAAILAANLAPAIAYLDAVPLSQ
jgi:hypothetical protein